MLSRGRHPHQTLTVQGFHEIQAVLIFLQGQLTKLQKSKKNTQVRITFEK